MEDMTFEVVTRMSRGAEGVEIVTVGFFTHAVQVGFPRQFDLPIWLVLQGCVALHLLGLPLGFLALPLGFPALPLGFPALPLGFLALSSEVVVLLGYMVVPHLLALPTGCLALVSGVVMLGCLALVSRVVMLGYMVVALLGYIVGGLLGCMVVALRLLGRAPRVVSEDFTNRWEQAWWLMRWDLPTTRTVWGLTFEQGDRFTVGDSDRAGCNRSEHGCEKRDG